MKHLHIIITLLHKIKKILGVRTLWTEDRLLYVIDFFFISFKKNTIRGKGRKGRGEWSLSVQMATEEKKYFLKFVFFLFYIGASPLWTPLYDFPKFRAKTLQWDDSFSKEQIILSTLLKWTQTVCIVFLDHRCWHMSRIVIH